MGNKVEQWQLAQRRAMPLEQKIIMSQARIRAWHEYWPEVHVSFSGGMDSTVLLHLVRSMYPDVPAVFINTGLEYPENVRHVKRHENVTIVRPDKSFKQVIAEYGYPVISKRTAQYIHEVQNAQGETATKRLRLTGFTSAGKYSGMSKIPEKWKYLIRAPFRISDRCCYWLKKRPFRQVDKTLGVPFIGTRADEGQQREQTYYRYGCNAFEAKSPRSTPLAFWTGEDIWQYVREVGVPYSALYDMGYKRSGCMFCMFGAHLEGNPNRFQRMKSTHPKMWRYCMDKLGLREVLEYIHVNPEPAPEQLTLPLFDQVP